MIIAVDTSSLVAYLSDLPGTDVDDLERYLDAGSVFLPPAVLSEFLSDPKLSKQVVSYICKIPTLNISEGFWERAGLLRAKIVSRKLKSRFGDALIAQSCIDNDVPLITRDNDFRHYAKYGSLKIF